MTERAKHLRKQASDMRAKAEQLDKQAAHYQNRAAEFVRLAEEAEREEAAQIPVDRSAVALSGGAPVTPDHREIEPETGQQKGYIVLNDQERSKGLVRPLRDAYRHLKCGKITTMARDIAETYARDPYFYSGTFCTTCRAHFPIGEDGEFTWYEMDGRDGPKVGT